MILEKVNSETFGLKINIEKTKWMLISKNKDTKGIMKINDRTIERFDKLKYLRDFLKENV